MTEPRYIPRNVKSATLQVRVRLDEMEYLTEQAERLGLSLSETVRGAIALSWLTAKRDGTTSVPSWIHPHDDTLLDVEEENEVGDTEHADERS